MLNTVWTTEFALKGETPWGVSIKKVKLPGGFPPQKGGNPQYQPDKRWKPPGGFHQHKLSGP